MCYSFFFFFSLLSFCYHAYWSARGLRNMLYLIKPSPGCFFHLIMNPRGYQYIGTSPFPDSFRFAKSRTNLKHHRDGKTQTSSTRYWSRPRLYSILGTPIWNNYFFCRLQKKISVKQIGGFSVLISRQPTIRQNRNLKKNISYSTKTPNSKKF